MCQNTVVRKMWSGQTMGEAVPVLQKDDMGEESQNLVVQHIRSASALSTPLRGKNYDVLKKVMSHVFS